MEIDQKLLKKLFTYKKGKLYWKISNSNRIKIGQKAGTICKGYYQIKIFGKIYKEHILVFVLNNGYFPKLLDHKDTDSLNNANENLRECDISQNNKNRKSAKNSSSKYLGVSFHKMSSKWRATIKAGDKYKHLGSFVNEKDAAHSYNEAAKIHHGEFANLNIINDENSR